MSRVLRGSFSKEIESKKSLKDEELRKVQQDIVTLSQKISAITGEPLVAVTQLKNDSRSPFVSGIREITDNDRRCGSDSYILALESLLEKIGEYDRHVLNKTSPATTVQSQRRSSKSNDLFSLPTHLHIVDRLLDLYAQSQRVTIIRTTSQDAKADNVKTDEKKVSEDSSQLFDPNDRKIIASLKKDISKYKDLLEKSKIDSKKESALREDCEKINASQRAEIVGLKSQLNELSEKVSSYMNFEDDRRELQGLINTLQGKIEEHTNIYQRIINVIRLKSSRMDQDIFLDSPGDDCTNLVRSVCMRSELYVYLPFGF